MAGQASSTSLKPLQSIPPPLHPFQPTTSKQYCRGQRATKLYKKTSVPHSHTQSDSSALAVRTCPHLYIQLFNLHGHQLLVLQPTTDNPTHPNKYQFGFAAVSGYIASSQLAIITPANSSSLASSSSSSVRFLRRCFGSTSARRHSRKTTVRQTPRAVIYLLLVALYIRPSVATCVAPELHYRT